MDNTNIACTNVDIGLINLGKRGLDSIIRSTPISHWLYMIMTAQCRIDSIPMVYAI